MFCLAIKSAFAGFFAVLGALAALIVDLAFIDALRTAMRELGSGGVDPQGTRKNTRRQVKADGTDSRL